MADNKGERIAKAIANAGVCSRRDAEARIMAGRVTLNNTRVETPATLVQPDDVICVDGTPIASPEAARLFRYYKPRGLLTTNHDPQGRRTIFDAMPKGLPRLITVGRLDANSEGLLLLTTSGALARTLEHPSTGLARTYRVRASGMLSDNYLGMIGRGIMLDGVRYKPIKVQLEKGAKGARNQWYRVVLREGKNREIRKVFAQGGLEVSRLIRIDYGPYVLGDLPEGAVQEVKRIHPMEQKKK